MSKFAMSSLSRAKSLTSRAVGAASLAALFAFPAAGFAASPSNASLSGSYVFQFSTVKEVYWSKVQNCSYPKASFTVSVGGQSANTEVVYGVMTFDGKGKITVNYTDLHKFNQAATNATMSIKCPASPTGSPTTNNGEMVQEGPTVVTTTGTYAVEANGTGSFTVGEGGLDFTIAGIETTGLSSTFLLRSPETENSASTGIAIHK